MIHPLRVDAQAVPRSSDDGLSVELRYGEAQTLLGQYMVLIPYPSDGINCPSAKQHLLDLIRKSGSIDFESRLGLNAQQEATRSSLLIAYKNYCACLPANANTDPSLDIKMLPWILSSKDAGVMLRDKAGQREIRLKTALVRRTPPGIQRSQFGGSSTPHSDLVSPEGIVIGTLLAEDPSPSDDNSRDARPVYVVWDDGPQFLRRFRVLTTSPVSQTRDFILRVFVDSDKMRLVSDAAQPIVENGQARSPVWRMMPVLPRWRVEDSEGEIYLRGEIAEFSKGDRANPLAKYDVDIPNNHFLIRRRSVEGVLGDHLKSFLTSLPGWLMTIETAAVACIGFVGGGWIKKAWRRGRRMQSQPTPQDM
jgi:hypothetical protein